MVRYAPRRTRKPRPITVLTLGITLNIASSFSKRLAGAKPTRSAYLCGLKIYILNLKWKTWLYFTQTNLNLEKILITDLCSATWPKKCNKVSESVSCSVEANSATQWMAWLLCPWNSPSKDTGVLSFPSPGDLPNPDIKFGSFALQVDFYHLSHQGIKYQKLSV